MKVNPQRKKREARMRRHRRIRAKIFGTSKIPRLSVFRSNYHISCQLIDDEKGTTLVAAHDKNLKLKAKKSKVEIAKMVGKLLAKKAKEKGIEKIVFNRGGYKYHGRVRALAEGAREGGLKF